MAAPKLKKPGLSEKNKKVIAISSGSVVLIAGAWWLFYNFTTVAPPNLKTPDVTSPAQVDKVVEFMGNERGMGRMSVPRQEAFLLEAYQAIGRNPESRARFIHDMHQMSSGQREVLNNAVFDIAHQHVMEHAREYASLPPSQQRTFLDKAYNDFEKMRSELGGANPADSLSEPLKKDMPGSSDEMMKVLVDRTNGKERAEAKPFVDAMASKYKEQQRQANKNR